MALTLNLIRTFVRTHLDVEQDDLPDTVLDAFIREGSKRIERAEARWPFYETFWGFSAGVNPIGLYPKSGIAADIDQIASIANGTFGQLTWLGFDAFTELTRQQSGASGRPVYWSEWADNLVFFPAPDATYNLTIRGYRKPLDWVATGTGGVPDMPDELHNTVQTWALSKAYAQQEDPEMSALYERQFSDELNEFRRRLVVTPHPQPLVLNAGSLRRADDLLVRPRFDWEVS